MGKPETAKELVEQVIALYTKGLGAVEVGTQVGVGSSTVYRVLTRNGVPIRKGPATHRHLRKITDEQIASAMQEYSDGASHSALARKYGYSRAAMRALLKRRGIAARPRGNTYKKFSGEQITMMHALYQEGVTRVEIAKRFKTCVSQIRRYLREYEGHTHANWTGGRTINEDGYIKVLLDPQSRFACMAQTGGYVLEHRLVMAMEFGRPLRNDETVHHKDQDRQNNALSNLQVRLGQHGAGGAYKCRCCGSTDLVPVELE
jgi:transposase